MSTREIPEIVLDSNSDQLLLGVESDSISGCVTIDRSAEIEEIEESIGQLRLECLHSMELLGEFEQEGDR